MVSSMLIKVPGCQTRSRLTETYKSVEKRMCIILAIPTYMATPEEKQIDSYGFENGITNVFLRESSRG